MPARPRSRPAPVAGASGSSPSGGPEGRGIGERVGGSHRPASRHPGRRRGDRCARRDAGRRRGRGRPDGGHHGHVDLPPAGRSPPVSETFEAGGLAINEVLACGGLAERNALLLQLTADIIGREVLAAPVPHASAVGAAIYAATAAGVALGGYADLRDAIRRMGSRERTAYRPRTSEQRLYESLYRDYLDLARHFGEGGTALMKRLRRLRAGSG